MVEQSLFRAEALQSAHRIKGEIVLFQSARTHAIVFLIVAIVACISLWLGLGTYARTETVRGVLSTETASVRVVALRPGRVSSLSVKEGDQVTSGQRLAHILTAQESEIGGSAINASLEAVSQQERLSTAQMELVARRTANERSRLAATLGGLAQQGSDLRAQIELQGEAIASARDLLDRAEALAVNGYITKVEIERRRQAYIVTRQDQARLTQQLNGIEAERRQALANMQQIETAAAAEIVNTKVARETLARQRAELAGERGYSLTSPIHGRVAALQTGLGRTVDGSIPLMEIVPEHSSVRAQIYVPSSAIGFVRVGQEVRLLYDAYPYEKFGSFAAKVVSISRTSIDPRQLAAPLQTDTPVYLVEVVPQKQRLRGFGDDLALQPGMTLSANIILDRRSFLDWLLTPLNAVMKRNG